MAALTLESADDKIREKVCIILVHTCDGVWSSP